MLNDKHTIPFFTIFLLLLFSNNVEAQTASISGIVVDAEQQAVENAHAILGANHKIDITDNNGRFSFSDVEPGSYRLRVSRIGYHTYSNEIKLNQGTKKEFSITLRPKSYESPTVVVTATRTRKDIEEVPAPVTVIKQDEINRSGNTRLSDVLAEQTGLTLTSDHGTGVQIQGFDSEYTKIMLNGQPMIGRTAGTFDLSRVSVGNIKQIEMIKGPSSALWGSDAMAGVINIITEEGDRPFEMNVRSRYGSHNTLDVGTNISVNTSGWQNNFSFNRNSSGGYSLVPGSISQTVPKYENNTGTYSTELELSNIFTAELHARYYRESQQSTDFIGSRQNPTLLDEEAVQEDYSITPTLHVNATSDLKLELEHHLSGYRTEQVFTYQESGNRYQKDTFDQTYNKSEARANYFWNDDNITTAGAGMNWERLQSDRYAGTPDFRNLFVYGQHEWRPLDKLNLIAGLRYDAHSEYANQLSPKFSSRYELNEWLHIRGSVGRGFKAPAFRQLFLNFTNPTVGYSVFGSSTVKEQIKQLRREGKIDQILRPVDQLDEITAERSWAYNAGVDLYPVEDLQIRVNAFRNNVDDLIEAAPIAQKTNGQSAFTYFNLQEIYTQGIESQVRWNPVSSLRLSAGYQFLDAKRQIQQTKTVQDENGNPVQKTVTRYEPLFNRSKHSANVKLFYRYEPYGIEANIRGNWRGRYGRIDANGNGFVNEGEYEDGYATWDTAIAKTFNERYTLRLGIDNVFDFTRPAALPYLPGRVFFAQVSLQLN